MLHKQPALAAHDERIPEPRPVIQQAAVEHEGVEGLDAVAEAKGRKQEGSRSASSCSGLAVRHGVHQRHAAKGRV